MNTPKRIKITPHLSLDFVDHDNERVTVVDLLNTEKKSVASITLKNDVANPHIVLIDSFRTIASLEPKQNAIVRLAQRIQKKSQPYVVAEH